MASDQEPQGLASYLDIFQLELVAIKKHTEQLTIKDGLVPKTLLAIQKDMTDILKSAKAYQGAGPSTPQGTGPTGTVGPGQSSSRGGPLTDDQKSFQALKGLNPNASVGGKGLAWQSMADPSYKPSLPQIGALTLPDLLKFPQHWMASKAANVATQSQAYQDLMSMPLKERFDEDGNYTQTAQGYANQIGASGGKWGSAASVLGTLAEGYTTGKGASDLAQKIADPLLNARNLGYLTGYSGGGQGPLGLANPGAIFSGLGQRESEIGFALNNNVSPGQATGIYNNLFGLGWMGGSGTNNMRQGLANLTNVNPLLGTDPQVAGMMDQATRMGQSSVGQFIATMEQVPQAMNAAHVSMQQMVSDMDAMGQQYKAMGGNYGAGAQAAVAFSQITGLPAGIMGQMLQNPMVQGQVFMGSGLMPWEQGLAPLGSQVGGMFSAMNMMSNALHFSPLKERDSIGLNTTISGQDQAAALMSHYFGVSAATIKNMMKNQKGIMAGTTAWQNSQDYQNRIMGALQHGGTGANSAAAQLNGKSWDALKGELSHALDSNGHRIFSDKAINQIQNAGNKDIVGAAEQGRSFMIGSSSKGNPTYGTWAQYQALHPGMNYNKMAAQIKDDPSLMARLPKNLMATIAKDRTKAIQKAIGNNTQQQNQGPQITVSLSPQARKLFHLSSNTGSGKAGAGAGGSQVNIPYAGGPSDDPMGADPSTADNISGSSGSAGGGL